MLLHHVSPSMLRPASPGCTRMGMMGAVPDALMNAGRPVASGSAVLPDSAGSSMEDIRESSHASAPTLDSWAFASCSCAWMQCEKNSIESNQLVGPTSKSVASTCL
jgi:hypothetical protein